MSLFKNALLGVGIIALIVLVVKFRVAIIEKLPISEVTKQRIIAKDPFTQFVDQKDTFQVIDSNKVKEELFAPIIFPAKMGLTLDKNDSQNSTRDLAREFMEGDWVGITEDQLRNAMFGHSEQKTTTNNNGIIETKQSKEDKLLNATFAQVEKEISTVVDKVLAPISAKGKVLTVQSPSSAQKVVLVKVINRFTGEISEVDANNIPQGYVVIGA